MIGDFAAAMSEDNITMAALKEHFRENTGKKPVSKTSFSSAVKYSSVTYKDGAYVLGAPEMVLRDDYVSMRRKLSSIQRRDTGFLYSENTREKLTERL